MSIELLPKILLQRYVRADDDQERASVVLIAGAGASLASGLPTWDQMDLRSDIVKHMTKVLGGAFVQEAWSQLSHHIGFPDRHASSNHERHLVERAQTDQLCSVACLTRVGREALIAYLQRRFGPPEDGYAPQLGYELVAHLVKHRFVDHVVSLNFDEILDSALCDELGQDGYVTVLSNSHSALGTATLPHLFKLHGTISQPDSLRFAQDETKILSNRTIELLNRAVFGSAGGARDARDVWFVGLGYSWKDRDLIRWIQSQAPRVKGVLAIALDHEPIRTIEAVLRAAAQTATSPLALELPLLKSVAVPELVGPQERTPTIDQVLWAVWEAVKGQSDFKVPSAARHFLMSHYFKAPAGTDNRPYLVAKHDRSSRLEAELFLAAGKANGMLTLSALARDTRIMRRFDATAGDSFLDEVDFLRRSKFPEVKEVFLFDTGGRSYSEAERFYLDHWCKRTRQRSIAYPILRSEEGGARIDLVPYLFETFLEERLREVLESAEVEVDPGIDLRSRALFPHCVLLPTMKSLRDATQKVVGSDWSCLLVIAESGRWLLEYGDLMSKGRVFLVEAAPYTLSDWTMRPPVDLSRHAAHVYRIGMPWWEHNRHLTLAISDDGDPIAGIYFRRRQKTPRISPVALEDAGDLEELKRTFLAYVGRVAELHHAWEAVSPSDWAEYNIAQFWSKMLGESWTSSTRDERTKVIVERIQNALRPRGRVN